MAAEGILRGKGRDVSFHAYYAWRLVGCKNKAGQLCMIRRKRTPGGKRKKERTEREKDKMKKIGGQKKKHEG